jgi:hypothetical protein
MGRDPIYGLYERYCLDEAAYTASVSWEHSIHEQAENSSSMSFGNDGAAGKVAGRIGDLDPELKARYDKAKKAKQDREAKEALWPGERI